MPTPIIENQATNDTVEHNFASDDCASNNNELNQNEKEQQWAIAQAQLQRLDDEPSEDDGETYSEKTSI